MPSSLSPGYRADIRADFLSRQQYLFGRVLVLVSRLPRTVAADRVGAVTAFDYGKHIWTLTPEDFVGIGKVGPGRFPGDDYLPA